MNIYFYYLGQLLNRSFCPNKENYSPCGCSCPIGNNNFELKCRNVLIEKIRNIFKSATPANFNYIFIFLSQNYSFIPEDIFGYHWINNTIELSGTSNSTKQVYLEIHREAFRVTRNFTKKFTIFSCDLIMLNLEFLTDFNQLTDLVINNSINVQMWKFRSLPKLTKLKITHCTGLNRWVEFPISVNSLEHLNFESNNLVEERVGAILDWILSGPSKGSLSHLDLSFNKLTRVPPQLHSVLRLSKNKLNNQQEPGFSYCHVLSLSLNATVVYLNLESCYITGFHPDSFKGFINFYLALKIYDWINIIWLRNYFKLLRKLWRCRNLSIEQQIN